MQSQCTVCGKTIHRLIVPRIPLCKKHHQEKLAREQKKNLAKFLKLTLG